MTINRRELFAGATLALAAGAALSGCTRTGDQSLERLRAGTGDWDDVRALFPITDEWIDMSAMLVTAHPKPVADAIEKHRRALDHNPVVHLREHNRPMQDASRAAAGRYFGIAGDQVALTDSTTQGVTLVYHGLKLREGDEVLTTTKDYYVTHEALRFKTALQGAQVRRIEHYDDIAQVSADELVGSLRREIRPNTRAVALTWVHSSTGLKIPAADISAMLRDVNANRDPEDRVLFCLDSVHGFGNQDATFENVGADFMMAGCHKWMFGPRGTGVVFGKSDAWERLEPMIPTFLADDSYGRWKRNEPPIPTNATIASPGGFKAFEHVWALAEAFELHGTIGKAKIAARTAELAGQLKEGLAKMPGITLKTPRPAALSAGIVSFEADGRSPWDVVDALTEKKIAASVAPYRTPYIRLTPSVRNSPEEIEKALAALREIVGGPTLAAA
jgi:selenocysteine lyase/cysteine desulfurase